MSKSLNIKIPLSVASQLDSTGELTPSFLAEWIIDHKDKTVSETPISELCVNYTFKVEDELHMELKIKAIRNGLAMNEMIGRLLKEYY